MTSPESEAIFQSLRNTPRRNIIADLVGHPHSMPTREEIAHMNPSVESTDLSEHLDALEDAGVVAIVKDEQHTFYRLTDNARTAFDEKNLFDKTAYQSAYEEIIKPSEIQALEDLER